MNLRRAFFAVGLSLFWIRYEPLPNRKEATSQPQRSLFPTWNEPHTKRSIFYILATAQLHFLHF